MKYAYNDKISKKANESLKRRVRIVQIRKKMLAVICLIVLSLAILLGSSICAFASASSKEELHKYYTSMQVESGDTLWDIAEEYVVEGTMSREDFIREVTELNHLSDGQIHSGDYIVITYYAATEN